MNQKEHSCCFTGHRQIPKDPSLAQRLTTEIIRLADQGIVDFYAGGAIGFDTLAAQTVLAVKKLRKEVRLHLILPCKDQDKLWLPNQHFTYQKILWESDSVEYVSEHYNKGCMHERNRQLVDACSHCLCYLTRNKGGTSYTVSYAKKQGLHIMNLADDFVQQSFFEK